MHVKDYVTYRMTGAFMTDRSDASGMTLYHREEGTWSEEILNAIGLDPRRLPEIHNSTDVVGAITPEAAESLRLITGTPVIFGGGAKGRLWRQMLAYVFGRPTLCPRLLEEATSLGAAVAAGVGVGLFQDFSMVRRCIEIVDRHEPDPAAQAVYDQLYPIFRQTYEALVPIFDQLHDVA